MEAGDKWWSWFGLLAGKLKERAWLRWILQNWSALVFGYICWIGFVFLWVVFGSIFFEPHSFTAKGLTFRAGDWVGFLMALGWATIQAAAWPLAIVAVVLSPVLVPLFVVGGSLWLLGLFLGSVALVGFGPFVVLFGGRALLLRKLARWFGEADKREAEEKGVMAALGLGDAPERSLSGKARLMDLDEVAKYKAKPKKGALTWVGKVGGEHFPSFTEKHVLIVAGTRGGKGRDLIIPNLWNYQGSVFVLDPKGENAKRTQKERQEYGLVFALDPFGVSGLPSVRFNPLAALVGESMITDAQTFADALIVGDDYFSSSARQLLTGLILYVVAEPDLTVPSDGENQDTVSPSGEVKLLTGTVGVSRDLITVRRLLMRDLKTTLESMKKNKAELFAVREIIRDIGSWGLATSEREWSSIKNSAIEQTKWLNSPELG